MYARKYAHIGHTMKISKISKISDIYHDIFYIFDILIFSKISWYFPTLNLSELMAVSLTSSVFCCFKVILQHSAACLNWLDVTIAACLLGLFGHCPNCIHTADFFIFLRVIFCSFLQFLLPSMFSSFWFIFIFLLLFFAALKWFLGSMFEWARHYDCRMSAIWTLSKLHLHSCVQITCNGGGH